MKIKLKPIVVQVVVVFGASSGIGRLAALEFAGRGAKVIVSARSEAGLKSLVEEIEVKGGKAFYAIAAFRRLGEMARTIRDLEKRLAELEK